MTEQQERLGLVALVLFLIWWFFIRDNAALAGSGNGYIPPNYNQQNMTSRSDIPGCSGNFAKQTNIIPISRSSSTSQRTFNSRSCCIQPTRFNP